MSSIYAGPCQEPGPQGQATSLVESSHQIHARKDFRRAFHDYTEYHYDSSEHFTRVRISTDAKPLRPPAALQAMAEANTRPVLDWLAPARQEAPGTLSPQ